MLKQLKGQTQKVDLLNEYSWSIRYVDLGQSAEYAKKALEMAASGKYHRGKAYAWLNLSYVHFLKSENQKALEYLSKGLRFFKKQESERGLPIALNLMGNIHEGFGDYETGLEQCQNALRLARMNGYKEIEGEALSVLGLIYSRLSDYDHALKAHHESMEIRTELGDQAAVASSLNRIARIFAMTKRYEKALENYNKSLKIREELKQLRALSWTYLGLASTYEDMEDYENARRYYKKNLKETNGDIDKRCGLQSSLGMGRILLHLNQLKEALKCFQYSLKIAEDLEAKPLQFEAYLALANYYESEEDHANALLFYKKYHALKEEVHNDETRNRLKNQQIAIAVEKTEKEKEIFQLRNVELKAANEEIQEQKEELQIALENLKATQSQLIQSEKMASIGQLVAGIAHEINNPVTFISAGVDSLITNIEEVKQVLDIYNRITPGNAEAKLIEINNLKKKIEYKETIREITKLITSVKTGTDRTTEIVKGLRTFSRLDEDVLKIADIHEGLDSTLILLRNKYRDRIKIEKHYGELHELECYPGQLNQVFMNILSNAIDAIGDKGTITIGTSKSNGSIRIGIKDTGRGIPENIKAKIFDPFFTTKEIGKVTGLGLWICHSIIEKHSGSIEVKSQVGKGSEFVIVLPLIQPKR